MYTTIEAELQNGRVRSLDTRKLPARARVLITLMAVSATRRPAFGTRTTAKVKLSDDALAPLLEKDLADWGLGA